MAEASPIPLLFAQQIAVAKVASDASHMPEMAQAAAKNVTQEMLRQEAREVQKPEESQGSSGVDDEPKEEGHSNAFLFQQKEKKEEPSAPSSDNPLVGNLLHVKI